MEKMELQLEEQEFFGLHEEQLRQEGSRSCRRAAAAVVVGQQQLLRSSRRCGRSAKAGPGVVVGGTSAVCGSSCSCKGGAL